ncbi:MAG: BMP family protein [Fervidicoccaceae archaeon]
MKKSSHRGVSTSVIVAVVVVVIIIAIAGIYLSSRGGAPQTTTSPATTTTPSTTTSPTTTKPPSKNYKLAAIFPGSVSDADFNTLGYLAINKAGATFGIPTSYSENVAVPDASRVLTEYINLGYNILWVHGAQFNAAAFQLASQYPNVIFIVETDGPLANQSKNVWNIDRNFPTGFYVLGAIASQVTNTGKIGYLGGIDLPFSIAELNAVLMAVRTYNSSVQVIANWVGDFNDAVKTRSIAQSMISQGVDVILSSVNLGNYGLFEAVKNTTVLVATKYTDKSSFAPKNYITSYVQDYSVALNYILDRIINYNETSGYYKMQFGFQGQPGTACYIQLPLRNVPSSINNFTQEIISKIVNGQIVVPFNTTRP